MFFLVLFACSAIVIAFKRYVPIADVQEVHNLNGDYFFLDLRNYQTTFKHPINGAYNIPYAYLKRYYQEIPNKNLVLISSDFVEKNLAARFLRKKNFKVYGYMIMKEKKGNEICPTPKNCLNRL